MTLQVMVAGLATNHRSKVSVLCSASALEISHAELFRDATRCAERLAAAGVQPRDRVGLLANNCYEWLVLDLALILLDAVSICFPLEYFRAHEPGTLMDEYGLRALFVDSSLAQAQLPPGCTSITTIDSLAFLPHASRAIPELEREDVFSLVFSSGTSGKLKKLIISKRGTTHLIECFGALFTFSSRDRILAFLPLSIFQQRWMFYTALIHGFDFGLTEPFRMINYLQTFRPTILGAPPLFYEHAYKKFLALPWFTRAGLLGLARVADLPLWPGSARALAKRQLFRPLHDAFGGRVRLMLVGAAPSKPAMLAMFRRAGLPLYEGYGLTETGYLSINLPGRARIGSVGAPVETGVLEIAADGEIIAKLKQPLCLGYLDEDEAQQRATFPRPGEIATGDIGRLTLDGFLEFVGRKKEVIVTAGGYKVHPESLERELEQSDGVDRVVVLGGDPFPDLRAVVSMESIASPAKVEAAVARQVKATNASHPQPLRINKVVFTSEPFTTDNGLLNRNLKVDRKRVRERFLRELTS